MVGVRGLVVAALMAVPAGAGQVGVLAVLVAIRASDAHMRPGQREVRGLVVESAGPVRSGGVAQRAVVGELRRHMVGVRGLGIAALVAVPAGAGQVGVLAVLVAFRARDSHMRPGQREFRGIVVEDGVRPVHSVVAHSAVVGKLGRGMIRVGALVEVCLVAAPAVGGRHLVLAVHMAFPAAGGGVAAREREGRQVVIQGAGIPRRACVAQSAVAGNLLVFVVRLRGGGEVPLVTTEACRGSALEQAVLMAVGASHPAVGFRQGEFRALVVEAGSVPRTRFVALRAIPGELTLGVGRLPGFHVIQLMAGVAIRGGGQVLAVLRGIAGLPAAVAGGTRHRAVRALQRKACALVIKRGARPLGGGVAQAAILWIAGPLVGGHGGGLVLLQVAIHTHIPCPGVTLARVALDAGGLGVRPREGPTRTCLMVESSGSPGGGGAVMAAGTVMAEIGRAVRGFPGGGPILKMAAVTSGGRTLEGRAAMTLHAARPGGIRVGALQRITGMGEASRGRPAVGAVAVLARGGQAAQGVVR